MLTDTRIKTAKPQAKLYKLTDERGLHLSVYPNVFEITSGTEIYFGAGAV